MLRIQRIKSKFYHVEPVSDATHLYALVEECQHGADEHKNAQETEGVQPGVFRERRKPSVCQHFLENHYIILILEPIELHTIFGESAVSKPWWQFSKRSGAA